MFDFILLPEKHAIALLKKDHDLVKEIFDRFERSAAPAEREKLIAEAVAALKVHATVEEEIFYPAVRRHVGGKIMNEADEEHHVARVLIAELDEGVQDGHRDAKFKVLSEAVRHHIREEENLMLPRAGGLSLDFVALGERILRRKAELKANGVPADAEHRMVKKVKGRTDTPAAAAHKRPRKKVQALKQAHKKIKPHVAAQALARTSPRQPSR